MSFPDSRKYRFWFKCEYRSSDFAVIGLPSRANDLRGERILNYPIVRYTKLQRMLWGTKVFLDRLLKKWAKLGGADLSPFSKIKRGLTFWPVRAYCTTFLLSKLIVIGFKDKAYDRIICQYETVELFTFCYKTELYLYSSAKRLNKEIIFTIDGWDIYDFYWLPAGVDFFESWGPFFCDQLKSRKIRSEKVIKRTHPFRKFEPIPIKKQYIVVYEAPQRAFDALEQITYIETLAQFAYNSGLEVVVKCFHQSSLSDQLRSLNSTRVYRSSPEYSDGVSRIDQLEDELGLLVPKTRFFVTFGLSHGILEFGLSGIPVFCLRKPGTERRQQLADRLEACGIVFHNLELSSNKDSVFSSISQAIKIKPNFSFFLH